MGDSKPRAWPNVAAAARDEAAEEAASGMRALETLIDGERLTNEEVLRRQAIAYKSLARILRLLESVGANTRPI